MSEGVFIISVGGTIDKMYPPDKGSYAFEFRSDPAVNAILKRARIPHERGTLAFEPLKDSLDMDDKDREKIANECEQAPWERIIITHGTDTMLKTAEAIAARVQNKWIVLTGSAQPECLKETDADFNIGFAYAAVQTARWRGVYIAMNGSIFHWSECVKDDDGFFRYKT